MPNVLFAYEIRTSINNMALNAVKKGVGKLRSNRLHYCRWHTVVKVIHTKYSKHRPSTVAHTFECVCSKINHGLNHWLFISLFKVIP